uniref:NADH dehydrogenase subunit 6 n=1 Tax=Ixodes uriae TaxID=59655 RepID=Q6F6C4_IXOUR|nr:NADH dehydrogenase subunit 6 [Ixodes uriae]BAD27251.1 NADH dehydrogenase subunit 6 [Ixodes uriae]
MFIFINMLIMSFFLFNHPMMMLLIIITTTISISILTFQFLKFMWMTLILILLILGGMLILFLYLISLIPNKKMIFYKKLYFLLGISLIITLNFHNQIILPSHSMKILFMSPSISWLMLMMIYLLLTLMVVMTIIISSNAPMKLYK